jgi:hypothetical protein
MQAFKGGMLALRHGCIGSQLQPTRSVVRSPIAMLLRRHELILLPHRCGGLGAIMGHSSAPDQLQALLTMRASNVPAPHVGEEPD